MFMYQNTPEKDSYVAITICLEKKEKEMIKDFFRCHFKQFTNSEFLEYDNKLILEKIIEHLIDLRRILSKYSKSEDKELRKICLNLQSLCQSFLINNLLRCLSYGVLVWKYSGEYTRINYPTYYSIYSIKEKEKINENDIEKIKNYLNEIIKIINENNLSQTISLEIFENLRNMI